MTFILIPQETSLSLLEYPINTEEELRIAQAALKREGRDRAEVWVGDPDGDHYKNGQILWAATSEENK